MSPLEQNEILKTAAIVKQLAERLSECLEVTRYNSDQHNEAWALAVSLSDIEASCRTFLKEQLPHLAGDNLTPAEAYEVLLDIGEEFRHILYHIIEQPMFYRYLAPETVKNRPAQKSDT